MVINVPWSDIKNFTTSRQLCMQWLLIDDTYWISAKDSSIELLCHIKKEDPPNPEQAEFETSFKDSGNKSQVVKSDPFSAKILTNGKKLYKREHGAQYILTSGENWLYFTVPYQWVKITGLEILFAEKLDYTDFFILDSTSGTYTTIPNYPLNQFGYAVNITENKYKNYNSYDADLYLGMQMALKYQSISAKTIGINFILSEVKS